MTTQTQTEISTLPKTKAAKTQDGISTGMRITRHSATAMDMHGRPRIIPAGSLITRAISSGFDGRIGMSSCHKLGLDGGEITFRAKK